MQLPVPRISFGGWRGFSGFLIAVRAFDQSQLADVARERYLRHLDSSLAQSAGELLLGADRVRTDQLQYLRLPIGLGQFTLSF